MDAEPTAPSTAVIRKAPKPPKPKAKVGRRPKAVVCDRCEQTFASAGEARGHECSNPKPMGRPRKTAAEPAPAATPPFAEPPHSKGYTRIFVDEHGADLAVPITEETEVTRRRPAREPAAPSVDLALPADVEQRRMIDEYGELDRRMQLRASDVARYETLKRAIKSWFDGAPPDADGTVEGEVYLLHLSARERERRVRDMRELLEEERRHLQGHPAAGEAAIRVCGVRAVRVHEGEGRGGDLRDPVVVGHDHVDPVIPGGRHLVDARRAGVDGEHEAPARIPRHGHRLEREPVALVHAARHVGRDVQPQAAERRD